MPVTTRFEGVVLRVRASGAYDWTDVQAAVRAAMERPAFVAGSTVLMFDTQTTSATRSSDELRDIAADLTTLAPSFGAVVILARNDLHYGLGRMLAAYAEHLGTEVMVFRSQDAADAWLRGRAARAEARAERQPPGPPGPTGSPPVPPG